MPVDQKLSQLLTGFPIADGDLFYSDQLGASVKQPASAFLAYLVSHGGGFPAGAPFSVQYNNGGAFAGFGVYTAASHTLQLDAADSASPNPQTIEVQNVLGGTPNGAGVPLTIQGSLSTGSGLAGTINFNTGFAGSTQAQNVTISIASPAVFTAPNHGFFPGQSVLVSTTGSLPTGLSTLTTFWVDAFGSLTNNTFRVNSGAINGPNVNTSGTQSGIQTVTPGGVVTITIANPAVFTANNHGLYPGQVIQFQTTGSLPTGLSPGTNYFVLGGSVLHLNTFEVSATLNGPPVVTSGGQSGTQTFTSQVLAGTQNPATTTVQIGPSQANITAGNFPALTINQTLFGSELVNPSMIQLNVSGNIDTSINFLAFAANGIDRFVTGYQSLGGSFFVLTSAVGETIQFALRQDGFSQDQMLFGVNATGQAFFCTGPGTSLEDTFLWRLAPTVWGFGDTNVSTPNRRGWTQEAGQLRVTADFPVTSSTTLATVTGLSVPLQAGRSYSFDVYLSCTDAAAGGVKAAISGDGVLTATSIIYDGWALDANTIKGQANATALATAVASTTTTATSGIVIRIKGTITVNVAGTLNVQFAQNTSNGTASTVKQGSYMMIWDTT